MNINVFVNDKAYDGKLNEMPMLNVDAKILVI